ARERDVCPGIRRHRSRGNHNVLYPAAHPDAKAAVVKVRVEGARTREDCVLVANARIEPDPALDREWAAQGQIRFHVIAVAATEAQDRFQRGTQRRDELLDRTVVREDRAQFVEGVTIEFLASNGAAG